jgi:hypothetical protein
VLGPSPITAKSTLPATGSLFSQPVPSELFSTQRMLALLDQTLADLAIKA